MKRKNQGEEREYRLDDGDVWESLDRHNRYLAPELEEVPPVKFFVLLFGYVAAVAFGVALAA